MDSQCIKETVCNVLKIFQHGKYLVAYVLKRSSILERDVIVENHCLIQYSPFDMHNFFQRYGYAIVPCTRSFKIRSYGHFFLVVSITVI